MSVSTTYQAPVAQLLTLGLNMRAPQSRDHWLGYRGLGLSAADVPELLRMAQDRALHESIDQDHEVWAPLHAWRALGQLKATAAIQPLLSLAAYLDDRHDEWYLTELPQVFACIGLATLEPLGDTLADTTRPPFVRVLAADSLRVLVTAHPNCREHVVELLTRQAWRYQDTDPTVTTYVVLHLVELDVKDAAEVIERAYAAEKVDERAIGTWGDIRDELGVEGMGLVPAHRARPLNPLAEALARLQSAPATYGDVVKARRKDQQRQKRRHRRR